MCTSTGELTPEEAIAFSIGEKLGGNTHGPVDTRRHPGEQAHDGTCTPCRSTRILRTGRGEGR